MTHVAALVAVIGEYGDGHMWGGGWWWLAMTLMMLIGIALVGLVVWAVVQNGRHRPPSGLEHARAILAERLARGEITSEEYRERLQHLS